MDVERLGRRRLRRLLRRTEVTERDAVPAVDETAPAGSPEGARPVGAGFFDRFPRFYETSETSPSPGRLNLRYQAILGANRDLLAGARVLDIASHDGRWSIAALESGAASVVGIEARPELVERAEANLRHYGLAADRYRFLTGDVFEVLARERLEVDVVLCLGFLYHTLRYPELLSRIRDCGPRHVVLDTEVHPGTTPVVRLGHETVAREGNAVEDSYSRDGYVLTGRPTVAAVELLAHAYGFDLERVCDWPGLLRDNPGARGIGDYRRGKRTTLVLAAR